jgi:hypothetical protein
MLRTAALYCALLALVECFHLWWPLQMQTVVEVSVAHGGESAQEFDCDYLA